MKVAICGLGIMGKNHLRVCKNLNFQIVSTYDPENGDNYKTFLRSLRNCDGLIIASPTIYHTDIIVDAKNENKDIGILCEKPISFSSKEKNREAVKKYNNSILVGQIERFNPLSQKLFEIFKNKQEEILQIKTTRVNNYPAREKIDCRKDIGIHDIDFCCAILGSYPEKVRVISNKDNTHELMLYNIGDKIILNEVSWKYPYKDRTLSILTVNGVYDGHFYNQKLQFTDWSGAATEIFIGKREPLELELLHFQEMCVTKSKPISDAENNYKILELMGY